MAQKAERQTGRKDERDFVTSLNAYEAQPVKDIPDKVARSPQHLFKGATATKQATAADIGAAGALHAEGEQSRIVDEAPAAAAGGNANADDAPVVDEDGTLGDQSDTGEGTSDVTSDSSTDLTDSGGDADPNADLTAAGDEGATEDEPPKGSARERIVELNDKLEGAMVFGKAVQEHNRTLQEENARLRAGSSTVQPAPAAAPVVSDEPGPMPDISDPEIAFDNDKYRARMQEWLDKRDAKNRRAIVSEMTGNNEVQRLTTSVNEKLTAYAKDHPDFSKDVLNDPVLKANQLSGPAARMIAKSPYTAQILEHFASDHGLAIRAARMTVEDQMETIADIAADLKARDKKVNTSTTTTTTKSNSTPANRGGAQPAARKSVSQAPPPPRITSGGGASKRFDPLDPSTSMDDFVNDHRKGKQSARQANRAARGLK
jgi:hypothetical protein